MATLSAACGVSDGVIYTSVAVSVDSGYPWRFTLGSEVVYVTGASSTVLSVLRGQDGTTASSHATGTSLVSAPIPTSGGGGLPSAHAVTHESGGDDEIDVSGLTGAGGTLAQVLALGNDPGGASPTIQSATDASGYGTSLTMGPGNANLDLAAGEAKAGGAGGTVRLYGGPAADGGAEARIEVAGASQQAPSGNGYLDFRTGGSYGAAAQFLGYDPLFGTVWLTPLVRHAAGVPSGAPTAGELPIAFDSTAVSGGIYYWTGSAWVKGGTI